MMYILMQLYDNIYIIAPIHMYIPFGIFKRFLKIILYEFH